MVNKFDPLLDQWYWHHDKGQAFFVTDIDDLRRLVTIQYFDGDIEELPHSEWHQLDIEPRAEPENWSGALDISEIDDFGTGISDTSMEDWQEPLQQFVLQTGNVSQWRDEGDDDFGEGHVFEEVQNLENTENERPVEDPGVEERPDGVFEEVFDDNWYAEYIFDSDSGLWRVNVFRRDVAEWRDSGFDSLEDAQVAAREVFNQAV